MLNRQEKMLRTDLASVVDFLRAEGNYVGPYSQEYHSLLANHGKMIRAALTLIFAYAGLSRNTSNETRSISSESLLRDDVHQNVITAASAIEVLHLATLVHDDVLDNAPTRRGKPTTHMLHGNKVAIYLGDLLLSKYMEIISTVAPDTAFLERQAHHINEIVSGDLLQESMRHNASVTKADYERCIGGKTATLFSMACTTGMKIAVPDSTSAELDQASAIGHELGVAFQIVDDISDFDITQKTGKPKQEDISDGIYTLPVILARDADPQFKDILEQDDPQLALTYLNEHGDYFDASRDEARKHLRNAQTMCSRSTLHMPEPSHSMIDAIIDKMMKQL